MNYKEYLKMTPVDLLTTLGDTFIYDVDGIIETPEDLQRVSDILVKTANEFSFLTQLLSYAKIECRAQKRLGKENKTAYEDAIDRKEAISYVLEAVELRYKTLSRIITIKQEINKELKMVN